MHALMSLAPEQKCSAACACAACRNHRAPAAATASAPANASAVERALRSPAQALDARTSTEVSRRFGHDFSNVRIHAGAQAGAAARALGAAAFTVGTDVVFDPRYYAPHTAAGRDVLVHELAHVVQQRNARVDAGASARTFASSGRAEREAAAAQRGAGTQLTSVPSAGIARQPVATAEAPPAAAAAAAPAPAAAASKACAWESVIPDAPAGATIKTKAVSGALTATPGGDTTPPAPDPKADAAVATIAAARAALPTFAQKLPLNTSQGAKYAGQMYTRYTDINAKALKPPKAPKPGAPVPADTRTAEEKDAYDSALQYSAWFGGLRASAMASKPALSQDDPKDAAVHAQFLVDLAKYQAWLAKLLFLDIAAPEGGTDSINTYDSQIVTWGGGLGGASHAVPGAIGKLASSTTVAEGRSVGAEVRAALCDAGVALASDGKNMVFVVVDTASKQKFSGNSALELMKADPHLLHLLVQLSRGEIAAATPAAAPGAAVATPAAAGTAPPPTFRETLRQEALDAQIDFFAHTYANGANAKAIKAMWSWPYDSVMAILHFQWWGGIFSWSNFSATNGDMKAIIEKAISIYKWGKKTTNGATVATGDLAAHCLNFGGASSRAVFGPAVELADDALVSGKTYLEFDRVETKTDKETKKKTTTTTPTYRELL